MITDYRRLTVGDHDTVTLHVRNLSNIYNLSDLDKIFDAIVVQAFSQAFRMVEPSLRFHLILLTRDQVLSCDEFAHTFAYPNDRDGIETRINQPRYESFLANLVADVKTDQGNSEQRDFL